MRTLGSGFVATALMLLCAGLRGEDALLPAIEVTARGDPLAGRAFAASEGVVGREDLERRPLQRPGEVLETVPGLIATQHSGAGKANQFFLRGFNLDHGTDFATFVNDIPINQPTHAHGQGYTDLNFLIPELVGRVHFRKGPYNARVGDFSAAGSAELDYGAPLDQGLVSLTGGNLDYARVLAANSLDLGPGDLTLALEASHDDGPWEVPQDYRKVNALASYQFGTAAEGGRWQAEFYQGDWTATDQIAARAPIGRFDSLDPTTGGESYRAALSTAFHQQTSGGRREISAWLVAYGLDLYSNFTYVLASPAGDQFEQRDRRLQSGVWAREHFGHALLGREGELELGFQFRDDLIDNGLYQTVAQRRVSKLDYDGNLIPAVTRTDAVHQTSLGIYAAERLTLSDRWRAELGLRGDVYRFDVDSLDTRNSDIRTDAIASPKGSLVYAPSSQFETYLSTGLGFHSNDGRGTTTRVDPGTGAAVDPVDPLVRSRGAELGFRFEQPGQLQSTLAGYWLGLDSELVYVGDAGTTEAGRPSRRYGIEWNNFLTPLPWLLLDADLAWTEARFTDADPAGDRIPGAVATVVAAGVSVDAPPGWRAGFASLRLRYFGPRPLIEDNSVRSDGTLLLNLQAGQRLNKQAEIAVQVFNLLNREDDDITYFYASRLPGEPAGAVDGGFEDRHFHPVEPRSARVALRLAF
jgi:hypothetical protein